MTRRGTTNSNARGSSKDRRARKVWLLLTFDVDLGPELVRCSFGCGAILTFETITVDRYPLPGCDGGTYARGNIRPACAKCNSDDGGPRRSTLTVEAAATT